MTCGSPREPLPLPAAGTVLFKTLVALSTMVFFVLSPAESRERRAGEPKPSQREGYRVLTLLYRSDTGGFESWAPSWWNTLEAKGNDLVDPSSDRGPYSIESVVTGEMRRAQDSARDCVSIHSGNLLNMLSLPSQVVGTSADLGIAALARYDVFVPGVSDLAVPAGELAEQASGSGLTAVLSNLVDKFTGQTIFRDRLVRNFGRFKVGVFAILLPGAAEGVPRGNLDGAVLTAPTTTARKMAYLLRHDGADVVIGIYHGATDDILSLSAEVDSVDLVICGGTGRTFESPVLTTGCPVLSSSGPDRFGRAVINVRDGRMTSLDNSIHAPDPAGRGDGAVDAVVKILRARTRALSGASLAKVYSRIGTDEDDDGQTPASRILSQALLGNLGVQAVVWTAGLFPGSIDRGTVAISDLARLIPENRRIVVFEAPGAEIAAAIRASVNAEAPHESRLRFGGVTFDLAGDQVRNIRVNGFRLEEGRRYMVAAPEPTADETALYPAVFGKWRTEGRGWVSDTTLRKALAWYLRKKGEF